jgi:hypothetical protein
MHALCTNLSTASPAVPPLEIQIIDKFQAFTSNADSLNTPPFSTIFCIEITTPPRAQTAMKYPKLVICFKLPTTRVHLIKTVTPAFQFIERVGY